MSGVKYGSNEHVKRILKREGVVETRDKKSRRFTELEYAERAMQKNKASLVKYGSK